jgi:hypothetical protein
LGGEITVRRQESKIGKDATTTLRRYNKIHRSSMEQSIREDDK